MNWLRNSHWHARHYGNHLSTSNGQGLMLAPQWWHGPGNHAATTIDFCEAVPHEWESNPERFLRIKWDAAAGSGDPIYAPQFRYTFLEQWMGDVRLLAGKKVTLSFQARVLGGSVEVIPILWQNYTDGDFHRSDIYDNGKVTIDTKIRRFDKTLTLPKTSTTRPIQEGHSYLGFGLDFNGQYGPTLDLGPLQLNEGGVLPIEQVPHQEEIFWALQ